MNASNHRAYYHSPIGTIEIVGNKKGLSAVEFCRRRTTHRSIPHPALRPALQQLKEYFQGKRQKFCLNLRPEGTAFQKRVWAELRRIPYGETASYGDIAKAIGKGRASRAVGGANHRNPLSIIIPCHRVIGSDGTLVGYGGGMGRKEWLLRHEQRWEKNRMIKRKYFERRRKKQ